MDAVARSAFTPDALGLEGVENPGYHTHIIPKGEVGEISKIVEEALEAVDADSQGASVMVLVELSDLLGAVEQYLLRHHPSLTLDDLRTFSAITQRAFTSGRRPSSSPDLDGMPSGGNGIEG